MEFRDYFREIKDQLDGKATSRLASGGRGTLVFVFPGSTPGEEPRRISIQIDDLSVRVSDVGEAMRDLPVSIVRASLDDWVAYTQDPTREHLQKLELYGDLAILEAASELFDQKRDEVQLRAARTNGPSRPKRSRGVDLP